MQTHSAALLVEVRALPAREVSLLTEQRPGRVARSPGCRVDFLASRREACGDGPDAHPCRLRQVVEHELHVRASPVGGRTQRHQFGR